MLSSIPSFGLILEAWFQQWSLPKLELWLSSSACAQCQIKLDCPSNHVPYCVGITLRLFNGLAHHYNDGMTLNIRYQVPIFSSLSISSQHLKKHDMCSKLAAGSCSLHESRLNWLVFGIQLGTRIDLLLALTGSGVEALLSTPWGFERLLRTHLSIRRPA